MSMEKVQIFSSAVHLSELPVGVISTVVRISITLTDARNFYARIRTTHAAYKKALGKGRTGAALGKLRLRKLR
jgi:hypothetical protein